MEKTYIKGNYRKSIFSSDKGYVIGLFKVRETNIEDLKNFINRTITFTGYFHDLNEDDMYCLYGEYNTHPKYGEQFNVTEYERLKPSDKEGLINFLSSDLFKGVGDSLASSIVETLGNDALNIIIKDKEQLLLVPRMTNKKMEIIYDSLIKYEESHQVIVYLSDLGFSMKDSLNIYNLYKKDTLAKLEYNPYIVVNELEIPFLKVDEIALKSGILKDDEKRIKAGIIYVFKKTIFENSDVYLYIDEIISKTIMLLELNTDKELLENLIEELILENQIVKYNDKYYLKQNYEDEEYVAKTIVKLLNKEQTKLPELTNSIKELENTHNIEYNDIQKDAIMKALQNNITIITGGPGTGKTTIIKAICELYAKTYKLNFEEQLERIALLAPTGRAAKRMSEATNLPASTIHRFLKWNKETNKFMVNEYNPSFQHLIIIDEVSMIDLDLIANLFNGLTYNIKVVLVGDFNQLPSVGIGQILKDLIDSEVIDTVFLNRLYRQDEDSYINTLAFEIKDNNLSENFLEDRSDYKFLKCTDQSIATNLKTICNQLIEKGYDYKRVQIMAPMYAGINGIDKLNEMLQEVFNKKDKNKNEIKYGDVIYRENDKVLQLVNIPDENISNGDIGIIKNIIKSEKTKIIIDFDGNLVTYEYKDLIKIKHGYIISIHKSQGSEFELVILPISMSYKRMLYHKLIYTAVTRAKRRLIILGVPDAFVYSASHHQELPRKTTLKEKIMHNILKS